MQLDHKRICVLDSYAPTHVECGLAVLFTALERYQVQTNTFDVAYIIFLTISNTNVGSVVQPLKYTDYTSLTLSHEN